MISYKYFISSVIGFFVMVTIVNFFVGLLSFGNVEGFADWGQLIFSIISGFLVLMGIQFLVFKSSRLIAYRMFKYSVLISIFITQFFRFLQNQLSAITVLLLTLVVFSALEYLIYEEKLLAKEAN